MRTLSLAVGFASVLAMSPVLAAPSAAQEVDPEVVAALKARPCPEGQEVISDATIRKMGRDPQQYWAEVAALAEMAGMAGPAMAEARQKGLAEAEKQGGKSNQAAKQRIDELSKDITVGYRCRPKGAEAIENKGNAEAAKAAAGAGAGAGGAAQAIMAGAAGGGTAGAVMAGATAAAPLVSSGIKSLFGKKPPTVEAMRKELEKGRLEPKGVKFVEGTAVLDEGVEESIGVLAKALTEMDRRVVLWIPAELNEDGEPDVDLQRERLEKIRGMLSAGGVPEERIVSEVPLPDGVGKEGDRKPAKRGSARLTLFVTEN